MHMLKLSLFRFRFRYRHPFRITLVNHRSFVGGEEFEGDVLQRDVLGVDERQSPGRLNAVGRRFGIVPTFVVEEGIGSALLTIVIEGQSSLVLDMHVADADVLHGMSLYTCNQTGILAVGIGGGNVLYGDVADGRRTEGLRSAHPVT